MGGDPSTIIGQAIAHVLDHHPATSGVSPAPRPRAAVPEAFVSLGVSADEYEQLSTCMKAVMMTPPDKGADENGRDVGFFLTELKTFNVLTGTADIAYELRLPASMSRMFSVFHVSLVKRYKDGNRGSAPPPAVLVDGEVECEFDKILAHRDTKTGRRSYYVQWRGLPPEENEWLTASKLKNATDVVQDYLNELSNRGRQAATVGRPDNAAAQGGNAVSASGNTDSQDAVVAKPKHGRGRPRKTGITAQKRGRGRPRKQQ